MSNAPRHRRHVRIYRLLLLLFPRRFRKLHGAQMEQLFDLMWRERREAARFGGTSWPTFWLLAISDVAREASQARFDKQHRTSRSHVSLTFVRISMDKLYADIRYALESLRRNPGFAAIAILTLGLGIGATTSVFSVADAVVLRPLPYPEPERLVQVFEVDHGSGDERDTFAGANFIDWKGQNTSFDELAAFRTLTWTVAGEAYPRRVVGVSVTPNFFAVFGVDAHIGRVFSPATDAPNGTSVAVIGHALWQSDFGGSTDALGKSITLNGLPHTIVGVMPADFDFPPRPQSRIELWTAAHSRVPDPPFDFGEEPAENRNAGYLRAVARLAEGTTLDDAQAEMTLIAERLAAEYPDTNANEGINLVPLRTAISGDVRPLLFVLLGAVGLVLLIACSNVANLLLAKAARREQEVALRKALGASHWRIVRQLLTESIVLAGLGGLLGVALSRYGTNALVALAPDGLPGADTATLDVRVLGFALISVLGAGVLFGMAPAVGQVGQDLQRAMREGAGGVPSGRRHRRMGRALIVAEVALSLLLVVGAGLMGRTFLTLAAVDPGFDADNTLVAHVSLPDSKYSEGHQVAAFFDQAVDKLRAIPGVESAGSVLTLPMHWNMRGTLLVNIEGRWEDEDEETLAGYQLVTPGYFRTLRIPLVRGRLLDETDTADAPPVALINEAFADRYFPEQDPMGTRVIWGDPEDEENEWVTIVGIVANTHLEGLDTPAIPETYGTYAQAPMGFTTLVARGPVDPTELAAAVRAAVLDIDPEQPISGISTMDEVLAKSLGDRRFNMVLLGSFALAALLMAAIGLYGVLSFSVAQRTREIGLRRALGAQPGGVVRLVVGEGFRLVVTGLLLGGGAAILLGRFIASQLYGVSALDPLSFAAGAVLVTGVALLACWVPARRAAATDPMAALRRG